MLDLSAALLALKVGMQLFIVQSRLPVDKRARILIANAQRCQVQAVEYDEVDRTVVFVGSRMREEPITSRTPNARMWKLFCFGSAAKLSTAIAKVFLRKRQ